MKFSSRARYGLRMCFLMGLSPLDAMPLTTLVKRTGLSEKYLEQILLKLRKGGIVDSERGVKGGYKLIRPASEISINEILFALDDAFEIADCASGQGCKDEYCPNKLIFKKLHGSINDILNNYTLQDMIDEQRCKKND